MRRHLLFFLIVLLGCAKSQAQKPASLGGVPGEPDYAVWNRLLAKYYDPAQGMDYAHLEASDSASLEQLRQSLGRVAVGSLPQKQQLAYWINLYNVNVVATVVDHYPVASIRDISTDPIIRLNVFKKETVPFGNAVISLNTIENDKIRDGFHDPRIHFAINCAALSCPPIRPEAYTSARVNEQLDDQVRKFAAGPGLRIEQRNDRRSFTRRRSWIGLATISRNGAAAESPFCGATLRRRKRG